MVHKILNKFCYLFKRYILRDQQLNAVALWYKVTPGQHLLIHHNLPPKPVIWDIGGFIGEWSAAILQQHPDATMHIFEPMPEYIASLTKRFKAYPNVRIHPFALGDTNTELTISMQGEGTSTFRRGGPTTTIPVRNVTDVMKELKTTTIDLLAINAEGAEYDILPALLAMKKMPAINNLLIQFHRVGESPEQKRQAIRQAFTKTHHLVFDIPYVWEKWSRTPSK